MRYEVQTPSLKNSYISEVLFAKIMRTINSCILTKLKVQTDGFCKVKERKKAKSRIQFYTGRLDW